MKRGIRIYDPVIYWLAIVATGMGLLFIFDAGYARSMSNDKGLIPGEFRSQLIFLLPALLACALATAIPPATWKKLAMPIAASTFLALILVSKIGVVMNGARRWLGVGTYSIQPAEFAKLAVVLYLAALFAERKLWPAKIPPRKDFSQWLDTVAGPKLKRCLPGVFIASAVYLIDKEPDLGTAAVVAVTAFAMFFPGNVSTKSIVAALAISGCFAWHMANSEKYRMDRILNHSNRWDPENVDDVTFQTVQSELSESSGGVLGVGIGNGRAKHVLPATTTDFVMATVGEETGLWGSLAVLAVIGGIVFRLLWQAKRVSDRFSMLVLYGIAFWLGIQTCVNLMMANGFLPAIGIPLPFISSGGSSLLALWFAVGLSQSAVAPATSKATMESRENAIATRNHRRRHRRPRLSGA